MKMNITKDGAIAITDFSPVQAYKIAIKLEKDGIDFYAGLLEKIKDEAVLRDVRFLIEQENEHLKKFEGLLDKTKEVVDDAFEEDDIVEYLNTHVFEAPSAQRLRPMQEAMNMERRSIVFYEGCLKHAKDPVAKETFDKILEEEQKHLAKFAEIVRAKCIASGKDCLL